MAAAAAAAVRYLFGLVPIHGALSFALDYDMGGCGVTWKEVFAFSWSISIRRPEKGAFGGMFQCVFRGASERKRNAHLVVPCHSQSGVKQCGHQSAVARK